MGRSFREHFSKKMSTVFVLPHAMSIIIAILLRNKGLMTMVSSSKDGEWASMLLRNLGYNIFRGSSSKGGFEALKSVIGNFTETSNCVITFDGPLGPAMKLKPGSVFLAAKTNRVMTFIIAVVHKPIFFKSWDRLILPKPFSKIDLVSVEVPLLEKKY